MASYFHPLSSHKLWNKVSLQRTMPRCRTDGMLADGMEDEDMMPYYSRATQPTKKRLKAEMKSGEQLDVHNVLDDCNTLKHAYCCAHGHFDRTLCLRCLKHLFINSTVCECGIYHLKCHRSCSAGPSLSMTPHSLSELSLHNALRAPASVTLMRTNVFSSSASSSIAVCV